MRTQLSLILLLISIILNHLNAQEIREYVVKRTTGLIEIDGQFTEPDWEAAAFTERFVIYWDGSSTNLSTQAKLLWDDDFIYIGFKCEDPDVWATFENRDDLLWNEEVIEILCDPDGDGLNYFEVQVNPLETILDLFLDKAYYAGGRADLSWDLDSIKTAVWVDGTINNLDDNDIEWLCEVALPFQELASLAPSLNFPPNDSDQWRILLTRYDYQRTGDKIVEISSWNQTDSRGFHVPEKFGRIIFSTESVVSTRSNSRNTLQPNDIFLITNYPNPFNSSTVVEFNVPLSSHIVIKIYNITGNEVITLFDKTVPPGTHQAMWNGKNEYGNELASGIYFVRIQSDYFNKTSKIILTR